MRNILLLGLVVSLASSAIADKDGGMFQVGSVSLNVLEDGPGGFPIASSSVSTNFFDVHGNLKKTITLNFFESELGMASTNTFFYDRHGDLISSLQELDDNLDGVVDRRSTVTYTNSSPNFRRQITFIDNNADGINDEIVTRTYTFDNDAQLIGLVTEVDTDADGITDFRSDESWCYDLDHRQLYYTNTSDLFSPGVPEVISTATYLLNEDGDPISGAWLRYNPVVGLTISGTATLTYDKFGNLTQRVDVTELPGPAGPTRSIATSTFFYFHRGLATRDFRPQATTKQF